MLANRRGSFPCHNAALHMKVEAVFAYLRLGQFRPNRSL
jgi:hypothetical protein